MLDPFSITVGIIATLQAANASAEIAKSLFDIAQRAGVIADEIEFFATYIQLYTSMISTVHNSVRELHQNNRRSRTIKTLEQNKTLINLASQSDRLMLRIEEIQPQVKPEQDGVGIKGRFKWVIKSPIREKLCTRMDQLKMFYQFVMLQVILETVQDRASRLPTGAEGFHDLQQELRNHRRMMETHIRSMQVYNHQIRSMAQGEFDQVDGEANADLQAIGRELIETGKRMVAEHPSSSTSFTTSSTRTRDSTSTSFTTRSTRNRGSTSTAHTRDESIDEHQEDDNRSTLSSTRSLHSRFPTYQPPLIQPLRLTRRSSARAPPAPNPTTQNPPRERPPPGPLSPTQHTTIEAPSMAPDSTYIGVYPSAKVIYLDSSLSTVGLAGYIRPSQKGETNHITALLNQDCLENIISQKLVTQLGLHFDPHEDPDDVMEVDESRDHKEPTKGVATFRWSDGRPNHKEFVVKCYVCDHTPYPLIFGQQFMRRREHYWGQPCSRAMDDDSSSPRNTIENGEGSARR